MLVSCNNKNKTEDKNTAEPANTEKTASGAKTIHLTEKLFLEKIADYQTNSEEWIYLGDKPCIIDFYADWCGPCKVIAPILEELAEKYKDEIYIYKVDVDQEKGLAAAFGIRSIPSLLLVPLNENPQMTVGALRKEDLEQAIQEVLLN